LFPSIFSRPILGQGGEKRKVGFYFLAPKTHGGLSRGTGQLLVFLGGGFQKFAGLFSILGLARDRVGGKKKSILAKAQKKGYPKNFLDFKWLIYKKTVATGVCFF